MVEKEPNTTPNMFSKHCAMLAIIILVEKKFLLQIIKKQGNFKLHFVAHLNAIYDMMYFYLSTRF
jgi:hypothetical protein